MKSKKQVEHFLKYAKYKSEMDYTGISLYCKEKYGLKLPVPSSYPQEQSSLTYSQFADWLDNGFGAGDVVKWEENIGLVQSSTCNEVKICLKIDRNGPTIASTTLAAHLITHAPENALERISDVLSSKGLEFGNPFFVITEKYIPTPGTLVCFQNNKTKQEGFGVVRNIDKTGRVIMYCYVLKNGTERIVKYNMHEELGVVGDFSFRTFKPTDYERKLLENELGKHNKTWNHYLKRIEPVDMRVQLGERYWYITDKMTVTAAVEKGTVISNKRYLAANYFKDQADAIRILSETMELRRDYLAEPEPTKD